MLSFGFVNHTVYATIALVCPLLFRHMDGSPAHLYPHLRNRHTSSETEEGFYRVSNMNTKIGNQIGRALKIGYKKFYVLKSRLECDELGKMT